VPRKLRPGFVSVFYHKSLRPERHAPKGLQGSAQGFNPGTDHPRATRPEGAPDRIRKQRGKRVQLSHIAIGTLILRNDGCEFIRYPCRPFRANRAFMGIPRVETLG